MRIVPVVTWMILTKTISCSHAVPVVTFTNAGAVIHAVPVVT